MFVRIKTRRLAKTNPAKKSYRAMVVRSVRIDGKPRQKVVLYLGTIYDRQLWDPRLRMDWLEACFRRIERSEVLRGRAAALKSKLIRAVSHLRGGGVGRI